MIKKIFIIPLVLFTSLAYGQYEDICVFTLVEQMPKALTCDSNLEERASRKCADEFMHNSIHDSLEYPQTFIGDGVEGSVFVRFVINENGKTDEIEVLRGMEESPLFKEAAIEAVKKLPVMIPGRQRGSLVRVQYDILVKFDPKEQSR